MVAAEEEGGRGTGVKKKEGVGGTCGGRYRTGEGSESGWRNGGCWKDGVEPEEPRRSSLLDPQRRLSLRSRQRSSGEEPGPGGPPPHAVPTFAVAAGRRTVPTDLDRN